jgi:hypothetical protein
VATIVSRRSVSAPRNAAPGRTPFVAFCIYLAVSLPILLFVIGDQRWFFGDEWSFLAERDAGNVGELFRSHGEHWTTIPVLEYRLLFRLFGLRTYLPYLTVVVVAHLVTAFLLRVVMRRAGVRPWTATIVAGAFVLFGPGRENILWAFQISFVAAIMFGLLALVAADHDGAIDRRDWLGLAAGAACLMCSGVSLVMVAIVGLTALSRRGWRIATFYVAPLAAAYATWFLLSDPSGIDNPYGRHARVSEVARFTWSGLRGDLEAIGGVHILGILLLAALVGGGALILSDRERRSRKSLIAPVAMAGGAVLFLVATGTTRWFITPVADTQSRYIYVVAALSLPLLSVCIDAIVTERRLLGYVALAVVVAGAIVNIDRFHDGAFGDGYQRQQRRLVTAMAYSADSRNAPAYVRPNPWYTIGWLRSVAARGDMPRPSSTTPALRHYIRSLLVIGQLHGQRGGSQCLRITRPTELQTHQGQRFSFAFGSPPSNGANYFVQDAILVNAVEHGVPLDPVEFKSEFGNVLEVERSDVTMRIQPADPAQILILCRQ